MDNQIKDNIIELLKYYNSPSTGKPYDVQKEVNIVVRNGEANITININPNEIEKFEIDKKNLQKRILSVPNIKAVNIIHTAEKKMENIKKPDTTKYNLKTKNIIAIASGKGGVGKSTVSANIAIALKELGKSVSLLDTNIFGPSIPRMMGINKKPITNEDKKLIPLDSYGVKCMSIGFLIPEDTPTIWRGPMVMKALEQLFINVDWGETDYMILDLPPGTGDTQLTIAQKVPVKGAIVVSTPQDVALIDARKGINMFKKVNIPVLGLIENMSYFICDKCNQRHEIFSYGGTKNEAKKLGTNFLGEIPLNIQLRESSDQGKPIGVYHKNNEIAKIYLEIAKKIIE